MRVVLQEGSRPNEIGYHFTDINGLLKILKSDKMLATNEPLVKKEVLRCKIKFPDSSEMSVDFLNDGREVFQFVKGFSKFDTMLSKLQNNTLIQKLKQFTSEELLSNLKISNYLYLPYKDLIGKKSWSYTRRPEGMSYRNMITFGEHTVRIAIDIDKLTDKGCKVIPFSWLSQSKSGKFNEFEERVFSVSSKSEGTDNFSRFITEIAFLSDLIVAKRLDKIVNKIVKICKKLIKSYQTLESLYQKHHDKFTTYDFDKLERLYDKVYDLVYCIYDSKDFSEDSDVEGILQFFEILTEIETMLKNKKIKIIFVNRRGKKVSELDERIQKHVDDLKDLIAKVNSLERSQQLSVYNSFNKNLHKEVFRKRYEGVVES